MEQFKKKIIIKIHKKNNLNKKNLNMLGISIFQRQKIVFNIFVTRNWKMSGNDIV